jgi:DNA-binding transcriptional regulator YdaS (Cro superfamily)
MIKMKRKVEIARAANGGKRIVPRQPDRPEVPAGRIPRISKLMALAIRFEGLLRAGVVSDQTELARLAKVTQPRMTQIMNLLRLAADIQEQLLFLPSVTKGSDPIHERMLRPIVAKIDWRRQREMWKKVSMA